MTTNNTSSLLLALPEDVQRRLLAGCRYEDLPSIRSVCRAFRDVVNSPRFKAARRSHGFVERGVVLVGSSREYSVNIHSAQTRAIELLQIFDFKTGQWRVGPSTPPGTTTFWADRQSFVVQEKLFFPPGGRDFPQNKCLLIYDPRTDAWAQEVVPSVGPWKCACAHDGRIIAFVQDEGAYERAPDGSWSAYTCTALATGVHMTSPSDGWGTGRTRAESILLG